MNEFFSSRIPGGDLAGIVEEADTKFSKVLHCQQLWQLLWHNLLVNSTCGKTSDMLDYLQFQYGDRVFGLADTVAPFKTSGAAPLDKPQSCHACQVLPVLL